MTVESVPIIETVGLTKRYGAVVAVDGLSLAVPRGGVFGLLGPNGSGKTTTIGMLLGLIAPSAGSLRLFGQERTGVHREDLHRIGAIVETPSFYPYLSGRDNLRYFAGISASTRAGEVDELLRLVELADSAHRKFSTYSLGMKQRLGIAYALLGDPELVFLDEPTNGLDPAGMAEVRDLVKELGSGGRTVLLSSHILAEVEQVCEHVAILARGRLIEQGRVEELVRREGIVRFTTSDDEAAMTAVTQMEFIHDAHRVDGYMTARIDGESWRLTRELAQRGIYVAEMAPLQVTLEHHFLEVTGEPSPAEGVGRGDG